MRPLRDVGFARMRQGFHEGFALGAFSTYGLETTMGILQAAEELGAPVIVQAGSSTFAHAGREALAAMTLRAADASSVPVGVHLDHARRIEEIRWCAEGGYTSVMVDGSALPFDDNVALTTEAVRIGAVNGVWVEGELGAIPGDENRSVAADKGEMTSPERAREFVERTGVDALAVAVGNVHGMSAEPRPLDLDLLARIHEQVPVPLVLHGASGLPDEQLAAAVTLGVAKVNVNTELRRALLVAYQGLSSEAVDTADLVGVLGDGVNAVRAVALQKIALLSRPALTAHGVVRGG